MTPLLSGPGAAVKARAGPGGQLHKRGKGGACTKLGRPMAGARACGERKAASWANRPRRRMGGELGLAFGWLGRSGQKPRKEGE